MPNTNELPACPGCHIMCALDRYQCGRGKTFFDAYQRGEAIPKRRGPRPARPMEDIPVEARLEHMLAVVPRVLRLQAHENFNDQVVAALARHENLAAPAIISGELGANVAAVVSACQQLEEKGIVEKVTPREGSEMYALTEAGRASLDERAARHSEASTRFFGVLSDEDRAVLLELLEKLVHGQPRPQRPRKQ